MSRFWYLQAQVTPEVEAEVKRLAADEKRSVSNMTARLIDEALEARRARARRLARKTARAAEDI